MGGSEVTDEEHDDLESKFDFEGMDPEKNQISQIVITDDMLRRRLTWDIVPCTIAVDVIKRMGLPDASEEVEETEHRESHLRMAALEPVIPVIQVMAVHAAESAGFATLVANGGEDAYTEAEIERIALLIFQSSLAIISEMNDVGFLHMPHGMV